jgi:hypothetical protein
MVFKMLARGKRAMVGKFTLPQKKRVDSIDMQSGTKVKTCHITGCLLYTQTHKEGRERGNNVRRDILKISMFRFQSSYFITFTVLE